jgi:hypothetical protein
MIKYFWPCALALLNHVNLLLINHLEVPHGYYDMSSIYPIGIKRNYMLFAAQNSSNGFLTEQNKLG